MRKLINRVGSQQVGAIQLSQIITMVLLAFVGMMFIVNIVPEMESQITSANITNSFTSAMVDMAVWVLPVGAVVALFYGVFKLFKTK